MPARSCPELLASRIDFNGDPIDIVWEVEGSSPGIVSIRRTALARVLRPPHTPRAYCARCLLFFLSSSSFFSFSATRQKPLKIDTREKMEFVEKFASLCRRSRLCSFNWLQDVSLSATSGRSERNHSSSARRILALQNALPSLTPPVTSNLFRVFHARR